MTADYWLLNTAPRRLGALQSYSPGFRQAAESDRLTAWAPQICSLVILWSRGQPSVQFLSNAANISTEPLAFADVAAGQVTLRLVSVAVLAGVKPESLGRNV